MAQGRLPVLLLWELVHIVKETCLSKDGVVQIKILNYGIWHVLEILESKYKEAKDQLCLSTVIVDTTSDHIGVGEPYGNITMWADGVVLDGIALQHGEIVVKTWSENKWVRQLLVEYPDNFVDTGKRVQCGQREASVWTYLAN
jgi:hypothetical protein